MYCVNCKSTEVTMVGSIANPSWLCKQCGSTEAPRHAYDKPVEQLEAVGLLPEGVWQSPDGCYMAECNCCGDSYELPCDPDEFSQDMSYCSKSERCCP